MLLSGLNLPGADLNSLWLARRAEYMDVFCNPVTLQYFKSLDPGSKACRDDRYMGSIYCSEYDLQFIVVESVWASVSLPGMAGQKPLLAGNNITYLT